MYLFKLIFDNLTVIKLNLAQLTLQDFERKLCEKILKLFCQSIKLN